MEIVRKKIAELVPAPYNPREDLKPGDVEYEKLKRSITEFGLVEPIIFNTYTGYVVGGHQRLKALIEMGETETDCVIVNLPPEKEKALNVALNKISGSWDMDKLELVMEDLKCADIDLSLTGFDDEDIAGFFKTDVEDDDFDVEAELSQPSITKSGDIWRLGKHTLLCGDSTAKESYEKLMSEVQADLVITDPPYNVDYQGTAGKIKNDNMSAEKFYEFLLSAFACMYSVMADHASVYVFHADSEGLNFRRAFSDAGLYLSECCIWKKNSLVLGRSPYQWIHEPVLFGWKKSHKWYADRKQTTVWEFDKPLASKEHPTMKPIPLLAYPIQNSSKIDDVVLDPFGGSGSTLIACEQTGRKCYTIELDEKFCDVIVKRYIEHTGSSSNVKLERDGMEYEYSEIGSDGS